MMNEPFLIDMMVTWLLFATANEKTMTSIQKWQAKDGWGLHIAQLKTRLDLQVDCKCQLRVAS